MVFKKDWNNRKDNYFFKVVFIKETLKILRRFNFLLREEIGRYEMYRERIILG